ncbi:MAG: NADPH-dependent 7-cyano-7-deazaguanine reductase QueF [Paludibacter sp.]|jgi:7-cyano-7-deazaguanine reductase|nr:NADPH-dependent 7-cyano-7-deazaguanine reductase QueF [Paludibacter sp.]
MDKRNSLLGKNIAMPEHYSPALLFRIERNQNRKKYNIDSQNLIFCGVDVWNCYEFSFLTNNGLPIQRVLKIIVPCESKFLVESKSLKLYLNSFNMDFFGDSIQEAEDKVKTLITNDLSILLECEIIVSFFADESASNCENSFNPQIYKQLTDLISSENLNSAVFSDYNENAQVLKKNDPETMREYTFCTNLLRSNCPVTNQPDFGDLYVRMKTHNMPDFLSILRYIVSFRKENHFHEEIVEMIYKRFFDIFEPDELLIAAKYTRRGGIDINPLRASASELIPVAFVSQNISEQKTFRQ